MFRHAVTCWSSYESRLKYRSLFAAMKVGDPVFIVSYRSGLEPGTRARIVALDGSSAWIAVSSPAEPQVLPVQTWDLLPARTYGCAVLHVICETIRSLRFSGGSTLLLTPEQLVRKLVEHGLSPRVARQCVDLWDTEPDGAPPLPVREWLRRIKRHYSQGTLLQPSGPKDQSRGDHPIPLEGLRHPSRPLGS